MLTMLGLGVVCTTLLNLLVIVALVLSYVWHDWLQPRLVHRRVRQRAFERLIAQSTIDLPSMMPEPGNGGECWEW